MVESGEIVVEGAGRGARYRFATRVVHRLPLRGLAEDRVWAEVAEPALTRLAKLSSDAHSALRYAFTEMLNNAIEHSGGKTAEIVLERAGKSVRFEVADDGIGVFRRVREGLELSDDLVALQELSKGKVTTMPARHTGEGIFFSSKIADVFEMDSGGLRWRVDNLIDDIAVGEGEIRRGTRVRFEIAAASKRSLTELFDRYTEHFEFSKSRTYVKLFAIGVAFVSRSEARRLLNALERFREVVLDFHGVQMVGQGFADEVFRVWANDHPSTALIPTRMSRPVAFMIERARRGAS
jgi:anti-sigma regulatory factor (Ser/Thr protein kinase)